VFTPSFTFHRRFAVYGGVNASGNALTDFWEYDLDVNACRQVPFDGGNALVPAALTQFAMTGDNSHGYLFGGVVGGAASDQMWVTTREAPARILVRACAWVIPKSRLIASTTSADAVTAGMVIVLSTIADTETMRSSMCSLLRCPR
jgi:hypothetical protein